MELFTDNNLGLAEENDINAIVDLLNRAYRGDASTKGWTTEAHLIAGDVRTNADAVKKVLEQEGSVVLTYTDEHRQIIGCVNLQQQDAKIYLGMFAVSPQLQGGGVGKKLLAAAETYAKNKHCKAIFMTVISVRTELIDWYKRHGYVDTGHKKQFEEDGVSGKHLQALDFSVLEKQIV
ncbi:MAG: GNAT family N-acetyltransferase [Chitinophagaceae bacterium]|nr:MAG: GNAT family N-acetyltransferase [Chitinophagaceae bacterium]